MWRWLLGHMYIVMNDKLEEDFRNAVFNSKGMRKGNIKEAIEEAIVDWIKKQEQGK
jgi:hypothetical protein